MRLTLPALDPSTVEPRASTAYPPPHDAVVHGRSKRSLTKALALTQFGVNVTELAPGASSALRHYHTHEDEFVFVLEGEVVLVTDAGEQRLVRGDCAGFPAGVPDGHHLVNRSDARAVVLEVGSRDDRDEGVYPDLDLHCTAGRYSGKAAFTKRDGTPL
jgi:uncharacterized cupin superfamily protein